MGESASFACVQRRQRAKGNLISGETGPVRDTTSPGIVFKLQYSLDGRFVAVAVEGRFGTSDSIAAFSASTGEVLWETKFDAILACCNMGDDDALWTDMEWHLGADSLTVCVMTAVGSRSHPHHWLQHLFRLGSQTGVISPLTSLSLSQVAAFTD